MTFLRVFLIARITFSEGVRARFFSVLLLISLGLLLTATYFQQFDFGTSELKFILDFSFGAVLFFGSVLTVVITTQIFFNEIEHRTAISILSRAISRWEFLLGKLFGIATLLFFFCLSTGILLSFLLGIKASELARESNLTENLVNQIEIFQFLALDNLVQFETNQARHGGSRRREGRDDLPRDKLRFELVRALNAIVCGT